MSNPQKAHRASGGNETYPLRQVAGATTQNSSGTIANATSSGPHPRSNSAPTNESHLARALFRDPGFARPSSSTSVGKFTRRATSPFSSPPTGSDPRGLRPIHSPEDAVADVVFVHGVGRDSKSTWAWNERSDRFWPHWLRDEPDLPALRLLSFGYNDQTPGPEAALSILSCARDLLSSIKDFNNEANEVTYALGRNPIIFIAHSTGGLVAKKALILGKYNPQYSEIVQKVHGMMFLSTPHRGVLHANVLSNISLLSSGSSQGVFVSELGSGSNFLTDVNEQFSGLCDGLKLTSWYETQRTNVGGFPRMLVTQESGTLGFPGEDVVPVDADHNTICSYESRTDANFVTMKSCLASLLEGISSWISRSPKPQIASQSPSPAPAPVTLEALLGINETPMHDVTRVTSNTMQGAGEWFWKRPNFREWASDKSNPYRILWLTGLPGTGKSTLAGLTILHLLAKAGKASTQYYFFVEAQPMKRSTTLCFRSLVYQAALQDHILAAKITQLHQDTGIVYTSLSLSVLWEKLLKDIVFKHQFKHQLHWIIDAMDEADIPVQLFKNLLSIVPASPIKIILLSRPSTELSSYALRCAFVSYEFVTASETKDDIHGYVSRTVRENIPLAGPLLDNVIKQVTSKAEGSFLWAKLAMDTLQENWHTSSDIHRALNAVPNDMKSLYRKMTIIIRSNEPRYQELALRILMWVACSFRALSMSELETALQPEFEKFNSLDSTIIKLCGHFIRIHDGSVSLIHATARKYLLDPKENDVLPISSQAGHERVAITCLQYLSNESISWRRTITQAYDHQSSASKKDRLTGLHKRYPLFDYALNNWAYHLRHADVNSDELLGAFKTFSEGHILPWIHAVACSGDIRGLSRAAQYLKGFLRHRRRKIAADLSPLESLSNSRTLFQDTIIAAMEKWAIDLIRIVGKFGSDLLLNPMAIYRHIPPLCPHDSILYQLYNCQEDALLSVRGISSSTWDDNLARLTIGDDSMMSRVVATSEYFITLISSTGTMVVWYAETCQELRRLEHEEYVTLINVNKTGTRIISSGRFSFKIWSIVSGEELYTISREKDLRAMCIEFTTTDDQFVVGYDDCSVVRYDARHGKEHSEFALMDTQEQEHLCPRLMVFSPDLQSLALAYRGRPVLLWDMNGDSKQIPRKCIRSEDQEKWDREKDEVWCAPEVVRWHPDGATLLVLYQDATILEWRLHEDEQQEFSHLGAREMVFNHDGTFLLSSNRDGTLSVWTYPKFHLVWKLEYDEFVRDLAFSPDGQRIYDTRGSRCNIWEPDALVRAEELDRDESSGCDISLNSEPVYSQDQTNRSQISALAYMDSDAHIANQLFCLGWEDGSVTLHDLEKGNLQSCYKVRKVFSHSDTVGVIALAWSNSGRYIISGDDSGRVIAKRLRLKDDGKWAVYGVLDVHLDETVGQFLFNVDESLVLISTASADRVFDMTKKELVCHQIWPTKVGRKWTKHPLSDDLVLWIDPEELHTHQWSDLHRSSTCRTSIVEETSDGVPSIPPSSRRGSSLGHSEDLSGPIDAVQAIAQPDNKRYIVCETLPNAGHLRCTAKDRLRLDLINTSDLDSRKIGPVRRRALSELASQVQRVLGCHRDKLIFLSHTNYICTWDTDWAMNEIRQHFFLPKDWINTWNLHLISINRHGTLLCPRNGEVGLIQYAGRL